MSRVCFESITGLSVALLSVRRGNRQEQGLKLINDIINLPLMPHLLLTFILNHFKYTPVKEAS